MGSFSVSVLDFVTTVDQYLVGPICVSFLDLVTTLELYSLGRFWVVLQL